MANLIYPRSQNKHTAAIRDLVARTPGMETRGFWAAVRALWAELDCEWDCREYPFRPDAYLINRDTHTIEIHEIVNTSPPSRNALFGMGLFWFEWDCEGKHEWLPELIVHREGARPQHYDLCYWYHASLSHTVDREHESVWS